MPAVLPGPDRCLRATPQGVHQAGASRSWWNPFPDIPVRCRKQAPDEAPRYARARFGGGVHEVSGALGDLGTFIPHIVGAVAVVGMAPAGIFLAFGLFYLFSGVFYGLPIPVQPMKVASAVVLTQDMPPGAIAGAGLTIGAFLVVLGVTGAMTKLARILPATVSAGLQLGIGLALAWLGATMMLVTPWLAALSCALLLLFLRSRVVPGVVLALVVGVVAGQMAGLAPPLPPLEPGFHLPRLVLPTAAEVWEGFCLVTLPQLPLTLTNAVIVTAALARQLFPREQHRVSESSLCLTSGIANMLAAPFGGYPMCHGAGGLAGHHRFGARTATAPALIGALFLALALVLGDQAIAVVQSVPEAALGALLAFSGLDLVRTSRPQRFASPQIAVVATIGGLSLAVNPALGFVVGWPLAAAVERIIGRRQPPPTPT